MRSFFLRYLPHFYRIEYFLDSYFSFFLAKITGSNFKNRTKNRLDINLLKEKIEKNQKKRLAIFVAFHNSNELPISNLNYLDILRETFFEIIYVHNGELNQDIKDILKSKGCYVICRKNIGQDFGAWKDSLSLINYYKLTNKLEWILLCNDSNFCLGGSNAEIFVEKFSSILENKKEIDFISLNCNYEKMLHYQSYFLCLSNSVFQNKKFHKFWRNYMPLSNRFHAIERGEKRLSKKVLNHFRPRVIYNSHELYKNISSKHTNFKYLIGNLPKSSFYLESCIDLESENLNINNLGAKKIINALESYNQSHVFGLLNIVFLSNPFFKKDVVRMGTFSFSQIYELLNLEKLQLDQYLIDEIMDLLTRRGTSYSYLESTRTAYRKGINPFGTTFDYHAQTQNLKDKFFN